MSYEYIPTTSPTTPFPLYAGWGFFLDVFGQGGMRGPLRCVQGAPQAPAITFQGDNRTGIYQPAPFSIGWSVFGFLRFLVDGDGVTYLNEAGFGGRFESDSLSDNRVYTLPDEDGTLALREDDQIVLTNLSGGTVAANTPVIAVAGGFDVAGAGDFAIGLLTASTANAADGIVQVNGKYTSADWTAVAGSSALTPNELYSTDTAGTVSVGTGSVIFQALDEQTVKILGAESSFSDALVLEDDAVLTADTFKIDAGIRKKVTVQTGTYTIPDTVAVVVCNSASDFTVTLPAATGSGQEITVKNRNTNTVTVEGDDSDSIDGAANTTLTSNQRVTVLDYAAGQWAIIG